MAWILEKISSPDWEKTFACEDAAVKFLEGEICADCRAEANRERTSFFLTPCGGEYDLYEEGKS
jgi:hypothetical protein